MIMIIFLINFLLTLLINYYIKFFIRIDDAPPPPLHIPAIPNLPLFYLNTFINDNIILAPLIPTG